MAPTSKTLSIRLFRTLLCSLIVNAMIATSFAHLVLHRQAAPPEFSVELAAMPEAPQARRPVAQAHATKARRSAPIAIPSPVKLAVAAPRIAVSAAAVVRTTAFAPQAAAASPEAVPVSYSAPAAIAIATEPHEGQAEPAPVVAASAPAPPEAAQVPPSPAVAPAVIAPPPVAPPMRVGPTRGARILRQSKPAYPAAARRDGAEGTVMLLVVLNENGTPGHVDVASSSGDSRLDKAAMDDVAKWQFAPKLVNGDGVAATLRVRVTFTLDEE